MSGSRVAYAAFQGARDRAIDEFIDSMAAIENEFGEGKINQEEVLNWTHYYANRLRQDIERADTTYKAVTRS